MSHPTATLLVTLQVGGVAGVDPPRPPPATANLPAAEKVEGFKPVPPFASLSFPPIPDENGLSKRFDTLVKNEVTERRAEYDAWCTNVRDDDFERRVQKARARYRFQNNSIASRIGLSHAQTSTTVDRAAGAIDTGLEGVAAGLTVAPIALFEYGDHVSRARRFFDGWTLTAASLRDHRTRFGTGLSYNWAWAPTRDDYLGEVRDQICEDPSSTTATDRRVKEEKLTALREAMVVTRRNYIAVCRTWYSDFEARATNACDTDFGDLTCQRLQSAMQACSDEQIVDPKLGGEPDEQRLAIAMSAFEFGIAAVEPDSGDPGRDAYLEKLSETAEDIEALKIAGDALIITKLGDDAAGWYTSTAWHKNAWTLAVDGSIDLAPIRWGFSPLVAAGIGEPPVGSELDQGELKDWRVKLSTKYKRGRFSITPGLGLGQVYTPGLDPDEDDPLVYVAPTLTASVVGGALDGRKLIDPETGRVRVDHDNDNTLVPHVTLGVEVELEVGVSEAKRPEFQTTRLHRAAFTFFGDFQINKNLAVRVGVPVSSELVLQKEDTDADPDIPKKSGLQWTVPVFVGTVLSI